MSHAPFRDQEPLAVLASSSVLMVEYWSAKFTLFKNGQYERDEWFIKTLWDAALLPNLRSS